MAQPPKSGRFGNKTLDGILKGLAKQRDATRVRTSRAQPTHMNMLQFADLLGATLAPALTFDEMFNDAVQRQRTEWATAVAGARAREEVAHPAFYRGRRKNALPW